MKDPKQRDVKEIAAEIGECEIRRFMSNFPATYRSVLQAIEIALQTERDRAERAGLWLVRTANSDGQWSEWTMTDIDTTPNDYRQVQKLTPTMLKNMHDEAVDLLAAFVEVEGLNRLEQAEVVKIGEDYYQRACAIVAKHTTTVASRRPLDKLS